VRFQEVVGVGAWPTRVPLWPRRNRYGLYLDLRKGPATRNPWVPFQVIYFCFKLVAVPQEHLGQRHRRVWVGSTPTHL